MKKKLPTTKYTDDEIAMQLMELATNEQQVTWILGHDVTTLSKKIEEQAAQILADSREILRHRERHGIAEDVYLKVIERLAFARSRKYYD